MRASTGSILGWIRSGLETDSSEELSGRVVEDDLLSETHCLYFRWMTIAYNEVEQNFSESFRNETKKKREVYTDFSSSCSSLRVSSACTNKDDPRVLLISPFRDQSKVRTWLDTLGDVCVWLSPIVAT